jgi:hypothetical protein
LRNSNTSLELLANVARTLVSAASRLVSTLFRTCDTLSKAGVDMSIRTIRKRASILSSRPNICEICGLASLPSAAERFIELHYCQDFV